MRLPIRPLRGTLPPFLERRLERFVWDDPRVIAEDDVSPAAFQRAMSAIHVGDTIKITESNRHPAADQMILDHVPLDGAVIIDIGASDGSTSVDLLQRLTTFGQFIIADRYFDVQLLDTASHTVVLDGDGNWILVVGRRAIAWPSNSRLVRLLYGAVERKARSQPQRLRHARLLNPAARAVIKADPRVTTQVHDVFQPWEGPRPTVIKVANLLRRLYFSDSRIEVGLRAILGSLDEGGYFLIVDNPRIKGMGPRAGLYQRRDGRFKTVEETADRPEIADLIESVR